jgi:hypothetical protein
MIHDKLTLAATLHRFNQSAEEGSPKAGQRGPTRLRTVHVTSVIKKMLGLRHRP